MKMTPKLLSLRLAPMTAGFALASTLPLFMGTASAFELNLGDEVKGSWDTTVSYGTGWRTRNPVDLSAPNDLPISYLNKDDGDEHFGDKRHPYTSTFKVTTDLEFKYDKYGALFRGMAFYDDVIMRNRTSGQGNATPNNDNCNPQITPASLLANCGFSQQTKDASGRRIRGLDAYVYGNFNVADRDLNVRLGYQVVNWGEALFIQGGINSANPASLAQLHSPGAEIKEALLPLPMAYFSYALSKNVTLESFVEFGWHFSEADALGTYYSTDDAFGGYGAERVLVDMTGSGAESLAQAYNQAIYNNSSNVLTNKFMGDAPTSSHGQYGVALRVQPEGIDTEFGIYAMNYNSHTPVARLTAGQAYGTLYNQKVQAAAINALTQQFIAGGQSAANAAALAQKGATAILNAEQANAGFYGMLSAAGGAYGSGDPSGAGLTAFKSFAGMNVVNYIDTSTYQLVYPENIHLYGLSFSTTVSQISLAGEVSYRPNYYVLQEFGDNLVAENAGWSRTVGNGGTATLGGALTGTTVNANQAIEDWAKVEEYTADLAAVLNLGNALWTDGLIGIVEVGAVHYSNYDRSQHYASTKSLLNTSFPDIANLLATDTVKEGTLGDYMTPTAWGYRLALTATYNDVFPSTTLTPQLRFGRDVSGNADRVGSFMQGRDSGMLGVNAIYNNALDLGLAYNAFWGAGMANLLRDRNNVTLTVKYSF